MGEGKPMKFFKEPTLWLAVLAAALNFAVTFGWDGLSAEQAAWINTAVNAVVAAVAATLTRPIAPQAFTYAVTSLAGLLGAYGLDFSQEAVGALNLLVIAVLGLLTRGQVSPTERAPFTGVLGNRVVTEGVSRSPLA